MKSNPETIRRILASNIRNLRTAAKMSQMTLAGKAKIDITTLNRIETIKTDTTISTLSRIRTVLKISWENLLKGI
jgi:transcriptional regulator with XRE-family HTH domain